MLNPTPKSEVATLLWLLCGAHCIAVFILHDDRGCFEDMPRATLEGHISVIICFVVAGLVPIMSFVAERSGPAPKLHVMSQMHHVQLYDL